MYRGRGCLLALFKILLGKLIVSLWKLKSVFPQLTNCVSQLDQEMPEELEIETGRDYPRESVTHDGIACSKASTNNDWYVTT